LIGTNHRVEVVATDSSGLVAQAKYTVTVVPDAAPQIAITSPVVNALLTAGRSITLSANVVDDSKGEVEMQWFVENLPVGRSTVPPFNVNYVVPNLIGSTLNIRAEAKDKIGQISTAQLAVSVVNDTTRPLVSIVSPRDGLTITETQDITLSTGVIDDVSVARIDFYLDGNLIASDVSPALVPAGSNIGQAVTSNIILTHQQLAGASNRRLQVRATDAAGNVGQSPETVLNIKIDAPPAVAFVLPAAKQNHRN
jgi:large repetitive protein